MTQTLTDRVNAVRSEARALKSKQTIMGSTVTIYSGTSQSETINVPGGSRTIITGNLQLTMYSDGQRWHEPTPFQVGLTMSIPGFADQPSYYDFSGTGRFNFTVESVNDGVVNVIWTYIMAVGIAEQGISFSISTQYVAGVEMDIGGINWHTG